MHTVLIVEDDDFVRLVTKKKVEAEGYTVLEAANRTELLKKLERHEVHIILLDVMLDKDNGIELIKEIKYYTQAPIIIVSSKDHVFDKIIALDMGADDYMCKPVDPMELLSRIRAHIRRFLQDESGGAKTLPGRNLHFGSWTINFTTFNVVNTDGEDAGLTKDEFDLLVMLASAPQVVFTRDKLFETLKGNDYESFDRAIDIQIARIRSKLGDDARRPKIIKTIRKVGYQFIAPVESG